ncbi:flotillin family protein [bacterium]|nr:flotillin family protein [bacterium]
MDILFLIGGGVFVVFVTIVSFAARYKRCPSDKILVVYGKIGGSGGAGAGGLHARCYHGGAAFVWPIIQDYQYLDLTPIPIDIKLEGALSLQNIRVNTPSTFTVGISTEPGIMENAAERMLGLDLKTIQELAKDIIFGQMRVVIATMSIESINSDRDKLIENISNGVEVELKKVGLRLINVNVQDITDESGYIEALGKEAAARAINDAKIKVAQQMRDGEIGKAEAEKEQRVRVSAAHATAVEGENLAAITVAQSNANRREKEAEADRLGTAAEKVKQAQALQESYGAEENAERQRAKREEATQVANVIVPAEIDKRRIEIMAEAQAEQTRRTKKGEADGIRSVMEGEAEGTMAILTRKATGLREIVQSAGGSPELAGLLMVIEQLPQLVAEQVKAISNLKIDSVTVWEGGRKGDGKTNTADFVSGLVGSLPPLHELTKNVGVRLPEYLGKMMSDPDKMADVGEALKSEASKRRRAGDRVRQWLSLNLELLTSFDKNKNARIDADELDAAVSAVLDWAGRAMDGRGKWFFSKDDQTQGPHDWAKIESLGAKHPKAFVNLEGSEFWIPYEAIALAIKSLR